MASQSDYASRSWHCARFCVSIADKDTSYIISFSMAISMPPSHFAGCTAPDILCRITHDYTLRRVCAITLLPRQGTMLAARHCSARKYGRCFRISTFCRRCLPPALLGHLTYPVPATFQQYTARLLLLSKSYEGGRRRRFCLFACTTAPRKGEIRAAPPHSAVMQYAEACSAQRPVMP